MTSKVRERREPVLTESRQPSGAVISETRPPESIAAEQTKGLTESLRSGAAPAFEPTAADRQYLEVYAELLGELRGVTKTAIAKKLSITRQALWKRLRARPGLDAWVNAELDGANGHYSGAVIRRQAEIAIRTGSPKHAELYLKATGRLKSDTAPQGPTTVNITVLGIGRPVAAEAWPGGVLPDGKR